MANFLDTASYLQGLTPRGGGTGGTARGALGMAGTGASLGAFGGPIGMGIGAGAGALVGGITGAINKHAASAPTDLTVQDARQAIARAYQDATGKPADPAYVEQAIRGQGWKPGDRYVGSGGLTSVIQSIQGNARREQGGAPAAGGGGQIGYRPGRELLDSGNKAALLRILGGA